MAKTESAANETAAEPIFHQLTTELVSDGGHTHAQATMIAAQRNPNSDKERLMPMIWYICDWCLVAGSTLSHIGSSYSISKGKGLSMSLNAHRVFTGPADADHYLAALTLEAEQEQRLRAVRDACREAIRTGLRKWPDVVHRSSLFEAVTVNVAPAALRPKFKMQGSFAYRTLNDPAHSPPQEIDLDDGIFVPVSFLNDNGRPHPTLISSGYFAAVEATLAPLCDQNGWTLVTDKPSCVRVALDGNAHIDFALYAIPDKEFDELVENEVLAKGFGAQDRAMLLEQAEFAEDVYQALLDDQIMLAHREAGWRPSDPRKLEGWFRAALRTHGEQLRRVSRYLKGWRDYHWESCRLSSIALMKCVVSAYDSAAQAPAENRDDLALLIVAEALPRLLAGRLTNPVLLDQYLDEGWSPNERQIFVAEAQRLHTQLHDAIHGSDSAERALVSLTHAFGDRIPNENAHITVEMAANVVAPVVLTAGLTKEMCSHQAPREAVKREGDRRYG